MSQTERPKTNQKPTLLQLPTMQFIYRHHRLRHLLQLEEGKTMTTEKLVKQDMDEGGICDSDCLRYLVCNEKKPYNYIGRYCPWKQNKKEGTQK